jgi:putative transposase
MILGHKIRLVPTKAQEDYFRRACGTARYTYNEALKMWKEEYEAGNKPNGRKLKKKFNATRRELIPWSYDVHRDCTSQPFSDLQEAFNGYFGGSSSYPVFKKKGKCKDSFYIANDRLKINQRRVRIPVLGWVKMRETLRWEGNILYACVSRVSDQWYLSVSVEVGDVKRPRTGDGIVGVDLGIKAAVTLSDGRSFEGPKALRRYKEQLIRLHRQLSRKQKGSKNLEKAKVRLARLYNKIACARLDFLHQTTAMLCRENKAVGMESLNVAGMMRNHKLARSISDVGMYEFKRQLTYKSKLYDTELVFADRFYPSSKRCSGCGFVLKELSLATREWVCPQCGEQHDRDVNAAKNLIPGANRELTPVEREALALLAVSEAKLPSRKQEFQQSAQFST